MCSSAASEKLSKRPEKKDGSSFEPNQSPDTSDYEDGAKMKRSFKHESEKVKNLAKVTRSLSRENSRGEYTPDGSSKPSFKLGSAKIMKLRNATRAMSSESSDSPKRKQSPKVSFKTRSDKVMALAAVTRKLGRVSDSRKEEEVRGRTSPFKANAEKVKMLSNISRSFSKEQGLSLEEKSTANFKSSAQRVGMLSKATTKMTPSKERVVSFDDDKEKPSGTRPKTSKWRQKEFSPSCSPSRPKHEATNMSRISSLFGSEVEIPKERKRPKSSRRSQSEEKGRQENDSKAQMGSYTDIYQVFSQSQRRKFTNCSKVFFSF